MKTCKIRQKLQFVKSVARNQTDFKVVQIFVTFKMLRFCVHFACEPVGRCLLTGGLGNNGAGRGLTGNGSPASERGRSLLKSQFNEFRGQRSLMAYRPGGYKDLDTTERAWACTRTYTHEARLPGQQTEVSIWGLAHLLLLLQAKPFLLLLPLCFTLGLKAFPFLTLSLLCLEKGFHSWHISTSCQSLPTSQTGQVRPKTMVTGDGVR